jgi:hypothetical protein
MLPLGIAPGPLKPYDLMSFLKPYIDEVNYLSKNGLVVKKNNVVVHESKVFLMGITGDIPGIADLMNHDGHMSLYGCRFCEAVGTHPPAPAKGMYFPNKGRMRSKQQLIDGNHVSCIQL